MPTALRPSSSDRTLGDTNQARPVRTRVGSFSAQRLTNILVAGTCFSANTRRVTTVRERSIGPDQAYDVIDTSKVRQASEKEGTVNSPEVRRKLKEAELESRREQRNVLKFELEELRQTRQDTTGVSERLAAVVAEIVALEAELRSI